MCVYAKADAGCYVPLCGTIFSVMAFLGLTCGFALRVSMSVAIVAMVNQSALTARDDQLLQTSNASNFSGSVDQCPRDAALRHSDGEFSWDRHQQAAALATFYYGQIITQVQRDHLLGDPRPGHNNKNPICLHNMP